MAAPRKSGSCIWFAAGVSILSAASRCGAEESLACGPRAVCLAARLLGREISETEIREAFRCRVGGVHSREEIAQAIEHVGLAPRAVRLDPRSPGVARVPLIVAVKESADSLQPDHFLTLYGEKDGRVQVLDFPHPPQLVPCAALARAWDGRGVYVANAEEDLPSSSAERPMLVGLLAGGAMLVAVVSLVLGFRSAGKRTRSTGA